MILAMFVVALHLGGATKIGNYAVFGFYCLSGYLMTLIVQETYGYTKNGFIAYALNRFLRIYPIYWVSIAISAALIFWFGEAWTIKYHWSIYWPETTWEKFKNVALFFPSREPPSLTPPAWALTVEIFFYVLIGLGISKSKLITIAWFGISVAYHIIAMIFDFGWEHRYFTIAAASLPFSTGAIIWHFRGGLSRLVDDGELDFKRYLPIFGVILMLLNWAVGILFWKAGGTNLIESVFFYTNYVVCSAMVVLLMNRTELPWVDRSLDKFFGDFSYPIYLIHYQVGFLVIAIFGAFGVFMSRPSPILFFASIPLLMLSSFVIIFLLERPIETVRARIKR